MIVMRNYNGLMARRVKKKHYISHVASCWIVYVRLRNFDFKCCLMKMQSMYLRLSSKLLTYYLGTP